MKKFLAILLALVMCLSLFAACGKGEDPTGTTGNNESSVNADEAVQKAADYVKSMYLDDTRDPVKVDFELTSVVSTSDGNFTVDWTVDNTEMVTITAGENVVKVAIEKYPAEDYTFTMTGTVKAATGETATVVLKYSVLKAEGTATTIEDGTYVISTDGLTFAALAESSNYGYIYPNNVTVADGTVTGFVSADVITITNVEGGVTLQDCYGRYIYLKGDYNSYNVDATAPAEGHIWTLLATDGGYQLVNAMNGKTAAYSPSYASWGAYPEVAEDSLSVVSIIAVNPEDAGAAGPEYGSENADKQVSIKTALDIATNIGGAGTTYKVYITGTVTEIASDVYGNMYVTDGSNTIYVYGCYDSDGTNRYDAMANAPKVGSTVKLYGILMQYGETQQMKNAWVISCSGNGSEAPAPSCKHTFANGTCTKCGEADPNYVAPKPQPSGAPKVGVAYKFGMIQENISTTDVYYLAGGMDGYYMATTTKASDAIEIYLEETNGGYYMYTMENGAKVYINMVVSGTHVNGAYEAAASTVYSWDAEHQTVVATVNDDLYWFATRNDKTYDTIGPCKISYEGFYCMFYAA